MCASSRNLLLLNSEIIQYCPDNGQTFYLANNSVIKMIRVAVKPPAAFLQRAGTSWRCFSSSGPDKPSDDEPIKIDRSGRSKIPR